MTKIVSTLAVAVALASLPACSALRDTAAAACAASAGVRASAVALVSDADARLDEAAAVLAMLPPGERLDAAVEAYAATRAALDAVRAVLASTTDACETLDVATLFAGFARAWDALAPFLRARTLGGETVAIVATPLCVERAR